MRHQQHPLRTQPASKPLPVGFGDGDDAVESRQAPAFFIDRVGRCSRRGGQVAADVVGVDQGQHALGHCSTQPVGVQKLEQAGILRL